MRVLGLAFAVLFAVTVPIATHANGPRSNMGPANSGPAPGIVLAWDGGGSGGRSGALSGQRTAGQVRQWNGQWGPPLGAKPLPCQRYSIVWSPREPHDAGWNSLREFL
jgi:hypothetical protein